ncbi:MAG: PPC domain-containing protein, partial [Lentisphaeria bacterium]|nr:PPC domain-containing protein [Lentisphaeria bacterium]
ADFDCDPKYCNLYTHTCQDEPFTGNCRSDEECQEAYGNPDYYCHPRLETCVLPLRPDECYDTQDCGDPDLVCNPKDNTCVERGTICSTDSDCNTGDVCLNGTCVFQCNSTCSVDEDCTGYDEICRNGCCVEDESCYTDYNCSAGESCINGWCTANTACVDDTYEDNDSAANAYRLSQTANTTVDYPGLSVCSGDEDWFALPVPAGHSIRVQIFFSDSAGDVDMKLYDSPTGSYIDSSGSTSDGEEVYERDTPVDTTYLVEVYGFSGASNTYDMRVTIEELIDPCNTPDAYEENDSYDVATAVTWPGLNSLETLGGLGACAGDDDWFVVTPTAGTRMSVSILFDDSFGDLNMQVFDDPLSGVPVAEGTSTSDDENVAISVNVEAPYYIRVFGAGSDGNTYSLLVEHSEQLCGSDDQFEPNSEGGATLMSMPAPGPDEYNNLFLCLDDEDWYAFPLEVGDGLKIDVLFSDAAGDIEAYLYEPDGSTADSSVSGTDNELVEINAAETAGLYVLKIYHFGSSSGVAQSYDLKVTYFPGGVDPSCQDDLLEPNDWVAEASPLGDTMSNAVLCGANEDYYALDLAAGERVTITCNYDDTDGKDLNLDLLDSDGTAVLVEAGGVYTSTNLVEISYRAEEAKTVYLYMYMVNPAPDDRDVYDLLVDRAFVDCSDGGYEDNNTWESATALSDGHYTNLVLCDTDPDDDEDWYAVALAEGER